MDSKTGLWATFFTGLVLVAFIFLQNFIRLSFLAVGFLVIVVVWVIIAVSTGE